MGGTDHIIAARRALQSSLDKSVALSSSLDKAGQRLDEIRQRLPSLKSAVRPILAPKEALVAVGPHIDRAVGPAAAVLKVFDAVHGLEPSLLSDPRHDLPAYLSLVRRLEEALRFLGDNFSLAVQWLDDIVEYLHDNSVADVRYLSTLKSSLHVLKDSGETPPLDGGLLDAALNRVENEFRRLLTENTKPLSMNTAYDDQNTKVIAPSALPADVIWKLQVIMQWVSANRRLDHCTKIYVEVRGSNVTASLHALDLDYLEISTSDFNDVQSIEGHIVQWGKHLEFAVKHLFEAEYKLCCEVFNRVGPPEVWMGCFAEMAAQTGIVAFLRFGKMVTESKKDPIKLLKLLDIFASLNRLRLDFNRLFGGKACAEIQNLTRDLIKRVIEGSCEIFWELLTQVELQRATSPPSDGGVPKLVSFITNYCNRLLGDDYMPILTQVLGIHRSWKQEKFHDRILTDAILDLIKALEQNFVTWSKAYQDTTLSFLFSMNTHWHLYKNLKGTKLGDLLGETWLQYHEHNKDHYAANYLQESWAKLPVSLSRDGLILFSGGRAVARDMVKRRLKAFNAAFDEMYRKQSSWVIPDRELREKTCQSAVTAIVPVYRSYMQTYGPLVEQDSSASKYAKYTAQSLEMMIGSLFLQKGLDAVRFRSTTMHSSPNGKINSNNVVTGGGGSVRRQYHTSPTTTTVA